MADNTDLVMLLLEIFQKIKESQERMIKALEGTWKTAPDDPEIRKQLTEAVAKTAKMQKAIKKIIKEK